MADTQYGVYQQSGKRMLLTYANGETETLTRDGEGRTDGSVTLNRVAPLSDGTRIAERISSFYYSGFTPGSGISGGVSSSSETVFSRDGTYTGSSFGGAFGSFDAGGGFSTGSDNADGGIYEIRDGLILSMPTDGSAPRREVIFQADGDIFIGDQALEIE